MVFHTASIENTEHAVADYSATDRLPSEMGRITFSNDIWNSMEQQCLADEKNSMEAAKDGFEWINIEDAIHTHSLQSSIDSYSEAHLFNQTVTLSRFLFDYLAQLSNLIFSDNSSTSVTTSSTNTGSDMVQLVLPAELNYQLAKDIVYLASDEPYGVAGCEMLLMIRRQDTSSNAGQPSLIQLDSVRLDPYTTPTFQIRIELTEDYRKGLFSFHNFGVRLGLAKKGIPKKIFVIPKFHIIKKEFYRSQSSSFTS